MNYEIKTNKNGKSQIHVTSGPSQGAKLNLEPLLGLLNVYSNGYEMQYRLSYIGLKYAIMAIESKYMEVEESNIYNDLSFLDILLFELEKAIIPADFNSENQKIRREYEVRAQKAEGQIHELNAAFKDATETIGEKEKLIMNLKNEIEEMKTRINELTPRHKT